MTGWRVRAYTTDGIPYFRNNSYSEFFTFTYEKSYFSEDYMNYIMLYLL